MKGLTYSQTISPSGVTSNNRPHWPSQISVLPLDSRCAPLMCGLKNVHLLGEQPYAVLPSYLHQFDVACIPFLRNSLTEATNPVKFYEYLSAGKPVVSTINGGPAEFVWHEVNGLKVYAHADSIAWGLGTLFTNFEWARWMGRNGRIAVETSFSWDSITDHVLELYRSVAGAAAGTAA